MPNNPVRGDRAFNWLDSQEEELVLKITDAQIRGLQVAVNEWLNRHLYELHQNGIVAKQVRAGGLALTNAVMQRSLDATKGERP